MELSRNPLLVAWQESLECVLALQRLVGIDVVIKEKLEWGDYAWLGNGPHGEVSVGVETKQVAEFLGSVQNKKLAGKQVPGMCRDYLVRYLVVIGEWRAGKEGQLQTKVHREKQSFWVDYKYGRPMTYREITGWLNSLEMQAGYKVRCVQDLPSAMETVASLWKSWQKPWDGHEAMGIGGVGGHPVELIDGPINLVRPNLTWRMAAQITGVSKLAAGVGRQFKTPIEMFNGSRQKGERFVLAPHLREEWEVALTSKGGVQRKLVKDALKQLGWDDIL